MTARKTKEHEFCINCGAKLYGKSSEKFCCRECGVAWRTKNVYRYKYTFAHRSKSPRNFLMSLRVKKRSRHDLSLDFLEQLYDHQHGLCAISGVPMTYIAGEGPIDTNMSIDRIDSGGGYTEDNVQLVCRRVNHMKSNKSTEDLLSWCKSIISKWS